MLVFVDESGDTGLKFDQGFSTHFAVTLVIFADAEEAERVRQRVDTLKTELRLPLAYEFHFYRNNMDIRRAFFRAIRGYDFQFFTLVVDKKKLSGPEFQSRASFYRIVCGVAFENAKHLLSGANVKFDEGGEKYTRNELASYLRQKLNATGTEHIKKIGTQNSKVSNLIQVADMVCGAVYRSYQNESDAAEYRNMIKHREESVLLWP